MNKYFKCNVHVGFFFFFLITKFFDKFNSASTLLYQHHNKKHFILFLWYVLVYKWHLDLTIVHVCLIFCTVPSFWSIWLHNAVPVSHHKAVHTILWYNRVLKNQYWYLSHVIYCFIHVLIYLKLQMHIHVILKKFIMQYF